MLAHRSRSHTVRLFVVGVALTAVFVLLGTGEAFAKYPQSATVKVPANGYAQVTSSGLPKDAKQGTIEAKPSSIDDADLFDTIELALADLPTRGSRVLACAYLSTGPDVTKEDGEIDVTEEGTSLLPLLIIVCIKIALALPSTQSAASVLGPAAKPACSRVEKEISIKITHKGKKYTVHVKGTTHKPRHKDPALLTCKREKKGVLLTLKPRVKGKTLRQAVGSNLAIGYVNTGSKPVTVKTTFAVK